MIAAPSIAWSTTPTWTLHARPMRPFAEECFARFYEAISSVDVEAEGIELLDTGLVNAPVLPDQFRQAFLAGDYYTAIDTDLDDTGTLRAWALFDTEPKEEFDEHTNASISIYLLARA